MTLATFFFCVFCGAVGVCLLSCLTKCCSNKLWIFTPFFSTPLIFVGFIFSSYKKMIKIKDATRSILSDCAVCGGVMLSGCTEDRVRALAAGTAAILAGVHRSAKVRFHISPIFFVCITLSNDIRIILFMHRPEAADSKNQYVFFYPNQYYYLRDEETSWLQSFQNWFTQNQAQSGVNPPNPTGGAAEAGENHIYKYFDPT